MVVIESTTQLVNMALERVREAGCVGLMVARVARVFPRGSAGSVVEVVCSARGRIGCLCYPWGSICSAFRCHYFCDGDRCLEDVLVVVVSLFEEEIWMRWHRIAALVLSSCKAPLARRRVR